MLQNGLGGRKGTALTWIPDECLSQDSAQKGPGQGQHFIVMMALASKENCFLKTINCQYTGGLGILHQRCRVELSNSLAHPYGK